MDSTHDATSLAYCRVDKCGDSLNRLGNRYWPALSSSCAIHAATESRVSSEISKRMARCDASCAMVARDNMWRPLATSPTRSWTMSHALRLLSTARLNSANSRICRADFRRIRMERICLRLNGNFRPILLPLFQGARLLRDFNFRFKAGPFHACKRSLSPISRVYRHREWPVLGTLRHSGTSDRPERIGHPDRSFCTFCDPRIHAVGASIHACAGSLWKCQTRCGPAITLR